MKYIPNDLVPLVKAITSLVQVVTLYLIVTWGYDLLSWFASNIGQLFS